MTARELIDSIFQQYQENQWYGLPRLGDQLLAYALADKIDSISLGGGATDHGLLTGLSDDDHAQYHNDSRGDIRYYTKSQLDAGQLDTRYYTESEVLTLLGGKANSSHTHNLSDLNASGATANQVIKFIGGVWTPSDDLNNTDHGALGGLGDDDHAQYHNDARGDIRYYTKTQLDAGQLDTRYFTETEVNSALSTNATNDRNRANHTGTQLASTISNFLSEVLNANVFTSSVKGLVPASGGGTTNFLRADGVFAEPPGGGGGSGLTEAEVRTRSFLGC